MSTGTYISGIGHAGLVGFLVFGWGFSSDTLPFEVTEVSVVSGEEFGAMTNRTQPDVPTQEAPALETPVVEDTPVETPQPEEVSETPTAPEPVAEPVAETPPEAPEITSPPEAEVTDTPPEAPVIPEVAPPTNIVIGTSPRPRPRPVSRVAPEAVAVPEPDTQVSEVAQQAVVEDQTAEATTEDTQEATSPQEASTETESEAIVPEDGEQIALAPSTSVRPPVRPSRPQPAPETAASTQEPTETSSAIDELLGELTTDTPVETSAAAGPPLTTSETDGLRLAVQACWSLPISTDAQLTTVVVTFSLSQSGEPSNIAMASSNGATNEATRAAYEAARRAIIRCTKGGYQLPAEKYEQWKDVEITFNPDRMRLR